VLIFEISVQVSPRWIIEPQGVRGVVGDFVSLHCQSRGVPTPTVVWMKASGKILWSMYHIVT